MKSVLKSISRSVFKPVQQNDSPVVPVIPAALSGITEVWMYDASIAVGITSGFETIMKEYMLQEHGLNITFLNKSVSGQNLAAISARWEAEKATITGRSDILIVTMPVGNSIDGSWETRTQTYKNNLISQFSAFINSISSNGNVAMPVNTTFRNYDFTTVNNEENGSLPYNENVVYPVASTITPSMWYDGKPFLDPYNIARNWYSISLASGDPVHYTSQGYHQLRTFWLDCIAARIKGEAPPRIARVENPTTSQVAPLQPAIVSFGGGASLAKSTTVYYSMQRSQSFVGTSRLIPVEGYSPNKMFGVTTLATPASGTNAGVFNTNNKSSTLLHDSIKERYVQTTSTTFADILKLTGFSPNQSVSFQLLSCRSAAGAVNRHAEFSLNAGSTVLNVDGAYSPGAVPNIQTIIGAANSSGEITLSWRCAVGSGFAYLNGVVITPM